MYAGPITFRDQGQDELDLAYDGLENILGRPFMRTHRSAMANNISMPAISHGIDQYQVEDPITINNLTCYVLGDIERVLQGTTEEIVLPAWAVKALDRELVTALEKEGIVFAGINEEHPEGSIYINHLFPSSSGILWHRRMPEIKITAIAVRKVLRGVTRLSVNAPLDDLPGELAPGLPRLAMNSVVAAGFDGNEWSKNHVFPDGEWMDGGFDNTSKQYGQLAFEGMVASMDDDGNVSIFRAEENARRFIKSCTSLKMPPISVDQFLAAVRAAVICNKKFIPPGGKLYVRPYMAGLKGGTGVNPAKQYLFAVEVSPFKDYMAGNQGIDIKAVEHERPLSGKNKVASNYATIFDLKQKAKDEHFNDIVTINSSGEVQECGSSNFFLVEKNEDDGFIVRTSSLTANILPGITRKSLIEVLRDENVQQEYFGANIEVIDDEILTEHDIRNAHGAFSTGTAAGITPIKRIKMLKGANKLFSSIDTKQFIKMLQKLLDDLRRGKIKGYEKWITSVNEENLLQAAA